MANDEKNKDGESKLVRTNDMSAMFSDREIDVIYENLKAGGEVLRDDDGDPEGIRLLNLIHGEMDSQEKVDL